MSLMWMYMCVWVYVSINACVKAAIIQFPLTQRLFLFSLSLCLSFSEESTAHSGIHPFWISRKEENRKKKKKASICTFRLIHFNDCHFNHNEPSVSGVCPFIIALIQCWFAWTAKPKCMINESSRCVEFKRNDPAFFFSPLLLIAFSQWRENVR